MQTTAEIRNPSASGRNVRGTKGAYPLMYSTYQSDGFHLSNSRYSKPASLIALGPKGPPEVDVHEECQHYIGPSSGFCQRHGLQLGVRTCMQ
eukprot:jgi/Botrbrau1/5552/Bobra.0023s0035.1